MSDDESWEVINRKSNGFMNNSSLIFTEGDSWKDSIINNIISYDLSSWIRYEQLSCSLIKLSLSWGINFVLQNSEWLFWVLSLAFRWNLLKYVQILIYWVICYLIERINFVFIEIGFLEITFKNRNCFDSYIRIAYVFILTESCSPSFKLCTKSFHTIRKIVTWE
jgi:hypothetical protein